MDTNVVVFDTLSMNFVAQDTGSTFVVFEYQNKLDTMFVYISSKIEDNVFGLCPEGDIYLVSNIVDSTRSYQWQIDTSGGFMDLEDGIHYIGVDTSVLKIIFVPGSWRGYKYRCVVFDSLGATYSKIYTLRFETTWEGDVDSAWENPGNWSCDQVPNETTEVRIPSGLVIYPIINSNAFCRTLFIDSTATIRVNSGFTLSLLR